VGCVCPSRNSRRRLLARLNGQGWRLRGTVIQNIALTRVCGLFRSYSRSVALASGVVAVALLVLVTSQSGSNAPARESLSFRQALSSSASIEDNNGGTSGEHKHVCTLPNLAAMAVETVVTLSRSWPWCNEPAAISAHL
jgi:hypothetical protein